jgi:hypothetical protein
MNARNIFLTNIFIFLFIHALFGVFIFQLCYRLPFPVTSMCDSIITAWRILEVMREESAANDWLSSVESLLPVTTVIPMQVFLLLAYLLVEDKGQNLHQILKVTTQLAQADSSQVIKENSGTGWEERLIIGIIIGH